MRPQMTPAQLKRARKLIRAECCNFDRERNECLALDDGDGCACVQSISYSLLCRWFRDAVLPLDPELEEELLRAGRTKACVRCGARYVPTGRNTKYCPRCAKRVRREKKTEAERKRRTPVDILGV